MNSTLHQLFPWKCMHEHSKTTGSKCWVLSKYLRWDILLSTKICQRTDLWRFLVQISFNTLYLVSWCLLSSVSLEALVIAVDTRETIIGQNTSLAQVSKERHRQLGRILQIYPSGILLGANKEWKVRAKMFTVSASQTRTKRMAEMHSAGHTAPTCKQPWQNTHIWYFSYLWVVTFFCFHKRASTVVVKLHFISNKSWGSLE